MKTKQFELNLKRIFSMIICVSLFLPLNILAQTVDEPVSAPSAPLEAGQSSEAVEPSEVSGVPIAETNSLPAETMSDTSLIDSEQTNVSPQNTISGQETTQSSIIESTFDPQSETVAVDAVDQSGLEQIPVTDSAPEIIPIDTDTGSSTPPDSDVSTEDGIDNSDSEQVTDNQSEGGTLDVIEETQVEQTVTEVVITEVSVAEITAEEFIPDEKHTFKLDGSVIATKEKPDWKKSGEEKKNLKSEKKVSKVPNLTEDNVNGSLDISGDCVDPYYVVLLYEKQEDYDKNPSSYIFNKAFDCKNGRYNYKLEQLPNSLKDGKYFLLIGGQGDVGSWKPITALIPVTIIKELINNEQ